MPAAASTKIAAVYMLVNLAMIWILPFFPAEPKLAPIFNPVDRMVTDAWPLLLVVPAVAIDLLLLRAPADRPRWRLAALLAATFVAIFFVVQWTSAIFLLSDLADNRFFANHHWSYGSPPGDWMREFWAVERDPVTPLSLAAALGLAFASSWVALAWGDWMRRVQR